MKIINTNVIKDQISALIVELAVRLTPDVEAALNKACDEETRPLTKFALDKMCMNAAIARETHTPVCQDTGLCVIFIEIGNEIFLDGNALDIAITEGVRFGYCNLRKSIVHPLSRENTGDNCPPIIHSKIVKGNQIKLSVMLKGFGSENMSRLYMLPPSRGTCGVKESIIETAKLAGSNPCPPIILGVGIGGDMEYACMMAKHSLLRSIGSSNDLPHLNSLETDLLSAVNRLNIGAQGLGGDTTCLGVFIEEYPTHISSIPVAINVQCHSSRHKTVIID